MKNTKSVNKIIAKVKIKYLDLDIFEKYCILDVRICICVITEWIMVLLSDIPSWLKY
jgi:hypothetical protein